jgi:hypothetical protein
MKKSGRVTLTVVAVAGLAACSRRQDPCQTAAFSEQACREAIASGGYYWRGSWVPMRYSYPYFYYYDHYRSYVSSGGAVHAAPPKVYGRPAGASSSTSSGSSGTHGTSSGSSSSSGVERGGFGSTGGGHAVGA